MNKVIGTEKKTWSKPELIVLIRSNPEEMVLTTCKASSGSWVSGSFTNCYATSPYCCHISTVHPT
jgi:hypothetical protein